MEQDKREESQVTKMTCVLRVHFIYRSDWVIRHPGSWSDAISGSICEAFESVDPSDSSHLWQVHEAEGPE